jgi:hypothetical protein
VHFYIDPMFHIEYGNALDDTLAASFLAQQEQLHALSVHYKKGCDIIALSAEQWLSFWL